MGAVVTIFLLSLMIGSALALQGGMMLTIAGSALFFITLVVSTLLTQGSGWSIMLDILAFNFGFLTVLGVRLSGLGFWRS